MSRHNQPCGSDNEDWRIKMSLFMNAWSTTHLRNLRIEINKKVSGHMTYFNYNPFFCKCLNLKRANIFIAPKPKIYEV